MHSLTHFFPPCLYTENRHSCSLNLKEFFVPFLFLSPFDYHHFKKIYFDHVHSGISGFSWISTTANCVKQFSVHN